MGCSQICYGIHIKLKFGFQTLLKFDVPNKFFFYFFYFLFSGTQWLWIAIIESQFKNDVPNTLIIFNFLFILFYFIFIFTIDSNENVNGE